MNGLGKQRSALGKYLDSNNISQCKLVESTGVSKATISRLCKHDDEDPKLSSASKILRELQKKDPDLTFDSFWKN